jgi:folylpolyglutamate synthase/dihydropteroate synthase
VGDRLSGYRAALDYLFERTTGGSRFGLERTTALLEVLGDPHQRLRVFHVAGTNGKGSACATLEAILRHRGFPCREIHVAAPGRFPRALRGGRARG